MSAHFAILARRRPHLIVALLAIHSLQAGAQTLYSFGNPTADEQLYIELINRARANPAAEGARLAAITDPAVLKAYTQHGVNLTKMQNEFSLIGPQPPVAPNAKLTTAARGHSLWMLNNATQSHDETNPPNTIGQRLTAAGYIWSSYGENIFAYSNDPAYGHAGFEVDWGPGPDGMQTPRGHRDTIHSSSFREIGVGVLLGRNSTVGPEIVTQDFGTQTTGGYFGSGVAYYDLNTNDFYDRGEGIAGLTVNVAGATNYCQTAIGGGWVVPLPTAAASRTTTFSGLGISQTRTLVVPTSKNAKADMKLTYAPPAITSAATGSPGTAQSFSFTAVGGATGYKWNRWTVAAAAAENCENLTDVTTATAATYAVVSTSVKQQGAASFHLINPGNFIDQTIELNTLFNGGTSPQLTFQSWLRTSTADEYHRVQVKVQGSTFWQDVDVQRGGSPQAAFAARQIPLPTMAGKQFRVRFVLKFDGGSYYGGTVGDFYGWFIDSLTFSGITALVNNVSQTLTATSASFTPAAGNHLLTVAPIISGIEFPAAAQAFTASAPTLPSFATWASGIENANSLPAGTIANNPNADPDGDGRVNLVEYAFGTAPTQSSESATRLPAIQPSASHFVIHYVRDTALTDVVLLPVASSDMALWKSPGETGAPADFTDTLVSTAGSLETREAKFSRSSGAKWFVRVRVTKP